MFYWCFLPLVFNCFIKQKYATLNPLYYEYRDENKKSHFTAGCCMLPPCEIQPQLENYHSGASAPSAQDASDDKAIIFFLFILSGVIYSYLNCTDVTEDIPTHKVKVSLVAVSSLIVSCTYCHEYRCDIWELATCASFPPTIILPLMYIYQVCLEDFSKDVCDDLYSSKNSDALDTVQAASSHWVLGSTFTLSLSSIITAQFLGSWSDTYGHKLPMLLPPLSKIVSCGSALCA